MKKLRTILILLFIVLAGLTAASHFYRQMAVDDTPPQLQCDQQVLEVSVKAEEQDLLQGVTATDNRDGDLTAQILVDHISGLVSADTAKITYAVFDSSDNVAKLTRTIRYTDYEAPKFKLTAPLTYEVGKTVTLLDRLSAQDLVDGDITGSIRMTTQNLNITMAGIYTITLQVTNSLGDTAVLPISILMQQPGDLPVISLREYLVYLKQGESFDPMDYVVRVTDPGLGVGRTGSRSDVEVISNTVDMNTPGTYEVQYEYEGEAGTGKTILTVVVE